MPCNGDAYRRQRAAGAQGAREARCRPSQPSGEQQECLPCRGGRCDHEGSLSRARYRVGVTPQRPAFPAASGIAMAMAAPARAAEVSSMGSMKSAERAWQQRSGDNFTPPPKTQMVGLSRKQGPTVGHSSSCQGAHYIALAHTSRGDIAVARRDGRGFRPLSPDMSDTASRHHREARAVEELPAPRSTYPSLPKQMAQVALRACPSRLLAPLTTARSRP